MNEYIPCYLDAASVFIHSLLMIVPMTLIEEIVSHVFTKFNCPAIFHSLRHFRVGVYLDSEEHYHMGGWRGTSRLWEIKKALTTLCKAIQTHTSLYSCSLRQWPGMDDRKVLSLILSLFEQPHFQCLTLTETSLSLENIQYLVHTFLTTPCNGLHVLKLHGIHIWDSSHCTFNSSVHSICASSFLLHKSLVLHCHTEPLFSSVYSYWVRSALNKWLSKIYKLQLHSITVTATYD